MIGNNGNDLIAGRISRGSGLGKKGKPVSARKSPWRTKLLVGRALGSRFCPSISNNFLPVLMAARPRLGEATEDIFCYNDKASLLILLPKGREVGKGILVIKELVWTRAKTKVTTGFCRTKTVFIYHPVRLI